MNIPTPAQSLFLTANDLWGTPREVWGTLCAGHEVALLLLLLLSASPVPIPEPRALLLTQTPLAMMSQVPVGRTCGSPTTGKC